jgi:hypothetical protein
VRKIAFILSIVLLSYGCATTKRSTKITGSDGAVTGRDNLYTSITSQNLTGRSFFIEKAEFRVQSGDGVKTGLGTIKFLMPDKFLISLKSNAGIEVARIFLKGDSLFINDRFNKRMYYGSTSYLKRKYGVTTSLLPVLLGDYVNDMKLDSSRISCSNGRLDILGIINNVNVKYLIDCELGKSILTIPRESEDDDSLEIRYTEFLKASGINIPGRIEIIEKQSNTVIEIRIQKIVSPWDGGIDFIPGKQYDKIHLQ